MININFIDGVAHIRIKVSAYLLYSIATYTVMFKQQDIDATRSTESSKSVPCTSQS